MKYFCEFLKSASTHGIRSAFGPKVWAMTNQEREWFEACQPFVFYNDTDEEVEGDRLDDTVFTETIDNAPFAVFSCETPAGLFTPMDERGNKFFRSVYCVVAIETEPTKFIFYAYGKIDGTKMGVAMLIPSDFVFPVVKKLLSTIKASKVGSESVHKTVKVGGGKQKRNHVIRRIVHVVPKIKYEKDKTGEMRHIDFSHRFNVRGHWRKIKSPLGKDRNGDYTVYGYTWVVDYEKGPVGPLVTKTRLVTNSEGFING